MGYLLAKRAAVLVAVLSLVACQVTEEKIELWKGTQNGPKKLAGTLIDSDVPTELRAKAAVALVEIQEWQLFRESFQKMQAADADAVILAVAPILGELSRGEGAGAQEDTLTNIQLNAKDALFVMYDFAGPEARAALEKPLIAWCVEGNYNIRAMSGDYNVKTIVKKIGRPAARALVPLLTIDQIAVKFVAELIREVDDEETRRAASAQIAKSLVDNVKKIQEVHLISASIIGGAPVADALLALATDDDLSDELQRLSLRAFSVALDEGNVSLTGAHVDKLFSMAGSSEYDQYQREETYYVIAQGKREEDVPRIREMLKEKNFFWKAVGLRCLLRMNGKDLLAGALEDLGAAKVGDDGDDVTEVVSRIAAFPDLLPEVRGLLSSGDLFSRAIAVYVLAGIGEKKDAAELGKLAGDGSKLPAGFEHKTLGEAAAAAVKELGKKG